MEHPVNNKLTPNKQKTLKSRRELLKVLAAGGGAVTASALLSGQWLKPVVEVGLLPAHAQSSTLSPIMSSIISCGGESSFLASSTEVLQDDDERIVNLFALVSPAPPAGTLIRFDVSVNGNPVTIDDSPPYVVGTDATGLADFNLATPFPLTVRPVLPGIGAGFDELAVGDIVTITFSFEPPVDPTFAATPCTASFTVVTP